MKMTDIVTNFPPQTYSSSFFINRLGDESGSNGAKIYECEKETQTSSNLLDCFINKVFPKFASSTVLAFLLLLSSLPQIAETRECKETGRVRVFKSLVDFQRNNDSFNPDDKDFRGNEVQIETQTDVVMKNSFVALDSDYIFKMHMENQKIKKLDDNCFYMLSCLNELSLYNNRIEKLNVDAFSGLPHLRRLNLGDNLMKEVPDYALGLLANLKVLNLTRNNIVMLHKYSFAGMARLEKLDLSHNNLYRIIPEAFQYFFNLQILQMGSNDIAYADADYWIKMKKLRVLNLTDNALERFDIANDFAFALTLSELYLGNNFLTKFNAGAINVTLPSLEFLDISDNPWSCLDLQVIFRNLNKTKVKQIGADDVPEEPTINGISCNKSMEWYEQHKPRQIHKTTSAWPAVPSTEVPNHGPDPLIIHNSFIITDIHRLYLIIFWLFGLVFTYILCDICIKTGCCRWAITRANRYRRAPRLDSEPDYFNLSL